MLGRSEDRRVGKRDRQTPCLCCCRSVMSASDNRARRAQTPRTARTATVATEVISGKCQNSHTIVAADRANIVNSAAIFVRERDASVMPASPKSMQELLISVIQGAPLNDHTVKSLMEPWAND